MKYRILTRIFAIAVFVTRAVSDPLAAQEQPRYLPSFEGDRMRHLCPWERCRSVSLAGYQEGRIGSSVRRLVMNTEKRFGYVPLLLVIFLAGATSASRKFGRLP